MLAYSQEPAHCENESWPEELGQSHLLRMKAENVRLLLILRINY